MRQRARKSHIGGQCYPRTCHIRCNKDADEHAYAGLGLLPSPAVGSPHWELNTEASIPGEWENLNDTCQPGNPSSPVSLPISDTSMDFATVPPASLINSAWSWHLPYTGPIHHNGAGFSSEGLEFPDAPIDANQGISGCSGYFASVETLNTPTADVETTSLEPFGIRQGCMNLGSSDIFPESFITASAARDLKEPCLGAADSKTSPRTK